MSDPKNILLNKSFDFALNIVKLYKVLSKEKYEYVLSKQLLKSGTSVGANIREAQNAQSKADFVHKLYIAQKECDESCYWLELLNKSEFINTNDFEKLHNEASSILKIIRSSILTTKQRYLKNNNP